MPNVEYSTENADYKQIYVVHTIPVKDSVFEGANFDSVDAVVLEAYHSEEWFDKLWKSEYKKFHDAVFQTAQRTGKPVYVTDVLTTSGGRGFEDVASLLPDFVGLIGVFDGVSKVRKQIKEKKEKGRRLTPLFDIFCLFYAATSATTSATPATTSAFSVTCSVRSPSVCLSVHFLPILTNSAFLSCAKIAG